MIATLTFDVPLSEWSNEDKAKFRFELAQLFKSITTLDDTPGIMFLNAGAA